MRTLPFYFLALLTFVVFSACDDDDFGAKVDDDGLTTDIRELLPDSILTAVRDLGHPIYGGANPPDVTGAFLVSPNLLKSSNIPADQDNLGKKYSDMELDFSDQDDEGLKVDVITMYENGTESIGEGSFIVGEDCNFSIFVPKTATETNGHTFTTVCIMSGCVGEDGIEDFHWTLVMVDDNGDPNNDKIENGQGRLFYDSDGLSEFR